MRIVNQLQHERVCFDLTSVEKADSHKYVEENMATVLETHYMSVEDNCCALQARMLLNLGSREYLCELNKLVSSINSSCISNCTSFTSHLNGFQINNVSSFTTSGKYRLNSSIIFSRCSLMF